MTALDELLDFASDAGRRVRWGTNALGRNWVGIQRPDGGWDEAVGPTHEDAARTLLVLAVRGGQHGRVAA